MYSMVILNEQGKDDRLLASGPLTEHHRRSPQWGSFDSDARTLVMNRSATLQVGNDHIDLAEGESYIFAPDDHEFYLAARSGGDDRSGHSLGSTDRGHQIILIQANDEGSAMGADRLFKGKDAFQGSVAAVESMRSPL